MSDRDHIRRDAVGQLMLHIILYFILNVGLLSIKQSCLTMYWFDIIPDAATNIEHNMNKLYLYRMFSSLY